jgi:signal transduction histidine kinase
MSLRARLRIAIFGLCFAIVLGGVVVGVHTVLRESFGFYDSKFEILASQVESYIQGRFSVDERGNVQTSPEHLRKDAVLARMLNRTVSTADDFIAVELIDPSEGTLLTAGPMQQELLPWRNLALWQKARAVLWPSQDAAFETDLPAQSGLRMRARLSMAAVRTHLTPQITELSLLSLGALVLTAALAALVSNSVARSLERLTHDVERWTADEAPSPDESTLVFESRELADLQKKLRKLAHEYRGIREHAAHLRLNFDQMLQGLEEAVLVFDEKDCLTMAARPAERLLLRSRNELIGKRVDEVLPAWTELGAAVEGAVRLRMRLTEHSVRFDRPNLTPIRLLVSVEMLEDTSGRHRGCLVTLQNTDARKALASEIDIAARLSSIHKLTSGVAHEMKNPLNAIALHLELARNRGSDPEALEHELRLISSEVRRLDRVVRSFLDFSRPMDLRMTACDLGEIADKARTTTGYQVLIEKLDDGSPVLADQELCRRAVEHVLKNAVEAGGPLERIRVRVDRNFDEYVLSVTDEGEGIPPEHHDKIYNLYFTTKPDCAGVGLAFTYLVVQLHNGSIDFDTKPGEGTTFRLRFPAAKAKAASA